MQEGKNWKACATTNWSSNGEFACRVLHWKWQISMMIFMLHPAIMRSW